MSCLDQLSAAMRPTPGPWEHGDNGLIYGQCREDDAEAPFVCDVIEDSAMQALGILSPVEEANARLIAAAPELLEALEEIYNWLTPDWQQSNLGNNARAAIAKATAIHQPTIKEA
jgi:hypothetical protein